MLRPWSNALRNTKKMQSRLSPVVVFEARSPVGRPQQRLNCTGQVDKKVAHEEKPGRKTTLKDSGHVIPGDAKVLRERH